MYEAEILEVFRKCDVRGFPIDCRKIANMLGIDLVSYGELAKNQSEYKRLCLFSNDAFTHYGNRITICYNQKSNSRRIRFSIMHEIGHYVLQTDDESKADAFAANILALPAVILYMNLRSAEEISRFFGMSISAANRTVVKLKNYDLDDGAYLIDYFFSLSSHKEN